MKHIDTDNEDIKETATNVAIGVGGTMLGYMIVNTYLFFKPKCTRRCQTINAILYHFFFTASNICLLVYTVFDYSSLNGKYNSLNDWSEYAGCVDSFMKITDYQASDYDSILTLITVVLILACIVVVCEVSLFVLQIYILCKMRKFE